MNVFYPSMTTGSGLKRTKRRWYSSVAVGLLGLGDVVVVRRLTSRKTDVGEEGEDVVVVDFLCALGDGVFDRFLSSSSRDDFLLSPDRSSLALGLRLVLLFLFFGAGIPPAILVPSPYVRRLVRVSTERRQRARPRCESMCVRMCLKSGSGEGGRREKEKRERYTRDPLVV